MQYRPVHPAVHEHSPVRGWQLKKRKTNRHLGTNMPKDTLCIWHLNRNTLVSRTREPNLKTKTIEFIHPCVWELHSDKWDVLSLLHVVMSPSVSGLNLPIPGINIALARNEAKK